MLLLENNKLYIIEVVGRDGEMKYLPIEVEGFESLETGQSWKGKRAKLQLTPKYKKLIGQSCH